MPDLIRAVPVIKDFFLMLAGMYALICVRELGIQSDRQGLGDRQRQTFRDIETNMRGWGGRGTAFQPRVAKVG